tara:strand:+ start:145 stop:495 length:351 start_codon:yes stop_codon:yes gene_type:complete
MNLLEEQNDPMRLQRGLLKASVRLTMAYKAHVPDTMTRIRVLPGVAVVSQSDQVVRKKAGKATLDIYIKFLPEAGPVFDSLKKILEDVKRLPGVEVIKVLSLGDRKVTYKGNPIVI